MDGLLIGWFYGSGGEGEDGKRMVYMCFIGLCYAIVRDGKST